jgi:hypothetical protein
MGYRKQNRRIVMLKVGCESGLRNRGIAYREMSQEREQKDCEQMSQVTEQEDCEQRNESRERTG